MQVKKRIATFKAEQWFPDKKVDGVVVAKKDFSPNRSFVIRKETPYLITEHFNYILIHPGDWILTSVTNQRTRCSNDNFQLLYQEV